MNKNQIVSEIMNGEEKANGNTFFEYTFITY